MEEIKQRKKKRLHKVSLEKIKEVQIMLLLFLTPEDIFVQKYR